jgi:hypothetical protein
MPVKLAPTIEFIKRNLAMLGVVTERLQLEQTERENGVWQLRFNDPTDASQPVFHYLWRRELGDVYRVRTGATDYDVARVVGGAWDDAEVVEVLRPVWSDAGSLAWVVRHSSRLLAVVTSQQAHQSGITSPEQLRSVLLRLAEAQNAVGQVAQQLGVWVDAEVEAERLTGAGPVHSGDGAGAAVAVGVRLERVVERSESLATALTNAAGALAGLAPVVDDGLPSRI